jgi:replicative DNA helicase
MSEENQTPEVTKTPLEQAVERATELQAAFIVDYQKFLEKGTASAAARARKALSESSKQNKTVRKELQLAKIAKVAEKRAAKAAAKAAV